MRRNEQLAAERLLEQAKNEGETLNVNRYKEQVVEYLNRLEPKIRESEENDIQKNGWSWDGNCRDYINARISDFSKINPDEWSEIGVRLSDLRHNIEGEKHFISSLGYIAIGRCLHLNPNTSQPYHCFAKSVKLSGEVSKETIWSLFNEALKRSEGELYEEIENQMSYLY